MAFLRTVLVRKRGVLLKIMLAVPAVYIITTLALMDRSAEKDGNSGGVKVRKPQQHLGGGDDTGSNGGPVDPAINAIESREARAAGEREDVDGGKLVNLHPRQEKLVVEEKHTSKPDEPHEVSKTGRVK